MLTLDSKVRKSILFYKKDMVRHLAMLKQTGCGLKGFDNDNSLAVCPVCLRCFLPCWLSWIIIHFDSLLYYLLPTHTNRKNSIP